MAKSYAARSQDLGFVIRPASSQPAGPHLRTRIMAIRVRRGRPCRSAESGAISAARARQLLESL